MRVWSLFLLAVLVVAIFADSATVHRRVKRSNLGKIIDGVKGLGNVLGIRSDKIIAKGSNLLAKIGDRPIVNKIIGHIANSDDDEDGDNKEDEKPRKHKKSFSSYAEMSDEEWEELSEKERRKAMRKYPKLAKLHDAAAV
uniref:RxLR effector protein n=1 Tax=Steinernema glaseri TaxID=37863 RepID=A0A1I7Z0W2_9BILA